MNRWHELGIYAAEHRADLLWETQADRLVRAVNGPRSTRAFLTTLGAPLHDLLRLFSRRQPATVVPDVEPTQAGLGW